ncbi:MAG TPA: ABC transporter ATP-binding protein [Acidimicrobiales bacterium]|nr:ABC transporter ATP-binding protein [Acidimicrobiales bacterium]
MPADTSAPAATCAGVVKIYWSDSGEVHALKGVDAAFPRGLVTAVVGPSGSGKSSLLRLLAGLDAPTAGRVRIGDVDLGGLSPRRRREVRRRHVGFVFQEPADNLLPYLTAEEQVRAAARLRGTTADTAVLLDSLGLGHRATSRAGELSGGEQQRLAFAAAVAGGPELVIADEPTAELDSRSAEAVMEAVRHLRDRGTAVVVSTHDPVVMAAADRTLFLRHGAVEAESTAGTALAVVDAFGRVQLPEDALALFPERRAIVRIEDDEVRITPP